MKKLLTALVIVLFAGTLSAGEKSEKAGEVVGKTAKETKEAGIILYESSKKGAKKAGEYISDAYKATKETMKDFGKGVKDGYKK